MAFVLRVLGPPALEAADGSEVPMPLGKTLALLAYAACARRPPSRDEAGELLWPAAPPERRRHSLRQALWLIRTSVSPEVFTGDDPLEVDPEVLRTDLALLRVALDEGDAQRVRELWRGPFLYRLAVPGASRWDRWVEDTRSALEDRFRGELLRHARHLRATGDLDEALVVLDDVLHTPPAPLAAWVEAVEVRARMGDPGGARGVLARARRALADVDGAEEALAAAEREVEAHTGMRPAVLVPGTALTGELVGRGAPLGRLREVWASVRAGSHHVVRVSGAAGVGKTRLVEEFLAGVEATGEARVVRARAHPGEGRLDGVVMADVLRHLLSLRGAPGISAASHALLHTWLPGAGTPRRSPDPDVRVHPASLVDAVVDLVHAVAGEGALVILIDDAHWLDDHSHDLLAAVSRRVGEGETLILIVDRDDARPTPGERVRLEPWRESEVTELLACVLTTPDSRIREIASLLRARTGGNPALVHAALDSWRAGGHLRRDGLGWRLREDVGPAALPFPATLETDRARGRAGVWAALAVAAAAATWLAVSRPSGPATPPPPYGGGVVVLSSASAGDLRIPVRSADPERWAEAAVSGRDPSVPVASLFRGADGSEVRLLPVDRPDGPDIGMAGPGGHVSTVAGGTGDQAALDLSPDGTRLLFASEKRPSGRFAHELRWTDLHGRGGGRLYTGAGTLAFGRWSPDADRIAFVARGAPDTLYVLSATGSLLRSQPLGEVEGIDWCGASVVAVVNTPAGYRLLRIDPAGAVTTVASPGAGGAPVCSPDGRGVLHRDILDGRVSLWLRDLESGRVHLVVPALERIAAVWWIPGEPATVVTGVSAESRSVEIAWGEHRDLTARAVRSDGTGSREGFVWRSLDPAVASASAAGRVTGNRPGRATLVVGVGASFRDTVVVTVADADPAGVLLRERFAAIDTRRWIVLGSPPPGVVSGSGGPELRLRGDAKYTDGLLSRFPVDPTRGLTIEVDFRFRVTRGLHQHFGLCLADLDLAGADLELGTYGTVAQMACFRYPSRERERRDLDEASLFVEPGTERRVGLPGAGRGGWTHVALQLRPDGIASLATGDQVTEHPVRLDVRPHGRWTILLEADAVDTEVALRDLVVWRTVRYPAPGS